MESDRKVGGLSAKVGSGIFEGLTADSKDNGKQNKAALTIVLAFIAILMVVGTEPLKVLLRNRIGKFALGIVSITISGMVYLLLGYLYYENLDVISKSDLEKKLLLSGALFYIFIGMGTLYCGITEYFRSTPDMYRGESVFFRSLIAKGVKREFIWTVVEPFSCIFVSLLLVLLHPLIGLPLLITSMSFLFNEWYNVSRKPVVQRDTLHRMQVQHSNFRSSNTPNKDDPFKVS